MTRLGPPIAHQLSPIAGKNMELFESFWNPSLGRRNLLIHYVFLKTFPDRPAVEGVYISKFQFQVFCCSRDKMLIKRGCKCWSRERKLAKFARLPTTEACLQDLQSMVWFNQFLVLGWLKRRNWAKKASVPQLEGEQHISGKFSGRVYILQKFASILSQKPVITLPINQHKHADVEQIFIALDPEIQLQSWWNLCPSCFVFFSHAEVKWLTCMIPAFVGNQMHSLSSRCNFGPI